ncbi:MAG: hypothetical protein MH321_06790 [Leptospiraceae bacterium]|nr:hypothetical protein [Leptospiraceae bacterium]
MLTALLLLLGLSGAGAGLYSVLKEPSEPNSDSGSNTGPKSASNSSDSQSSSNDKTGASTRKQYQEKSPENLPLGDYGDSKKQAQSEKEKYNIPKGAKPPKVTYPVDEIISKNSKYSHHRRPIINAEALIDKLDLKGATELYQRASSRIPDEEIIHKIQTNIEDLNKFLEDSKKLDDLYKGKEEESNFDDLKSKIPISGPIPIRDLAEAIREISEALAESLHKGFLPQAPLSAAQSYPQATSPSSGGMPNPAGQPGSSSPLAPPSSDFNRQLPEDYFPAPIVYQFVNASPHNLAPSAHPSNSPSPSTSQPQYPNLENKPTATDFKEDLWSPGTLDLPDDTFFSREWDKFKDLPLTDRRSGKERRQTKDRRTGFNRKDRRSGEDRRKEDLFKLREEYLKQKAKEKKDSNLNQPQPGSLSDTLEPHLPSPLSLPDINLPDPDEYKVQDGRIIRISLEPYEVTDANLPDPVTITPDVSPVSLEMPQMPLPEAKQEIAFPQSPEDYVGLPDPENFQTEGLIEKPSELPPQLPRPLPREEPREERRPEENTSSELDLSLPTIGLPDPEDFAKEKLSEGVLDSKTPEYEDGIDEEGEIPDIEVVDGDLDEQLGEIEPEEQEPEKILHGVLELKPPEVDDAPFLTLTYDFGKIPHGFRLSRNYSIMEYSYYKYKPMLMKAQEFARRKMLKNALNYYRVVKSQNIPPEMRKMINRNIRDITEFMEKFLMAKGG